MPKTIIDEYFFYQEKYTKLYGNNTIVFMMIGTFYEAYATNNRGYNLSTISEITNLVKTRKDKKIELIDEKNPYMVGFNINALDKFLKILVDNGFTVIIIDQITPPPNPKRAVTGIYSSGTYLNDITLSESNNIVSIYMEDEKQLNGQYELCIGLSSIDLTTGECLTYEILTNSNQNDDKYTLDEAYRFLISSNPKEIILSRYEIPNHSLKKEFIFSYLEIDNKNVHYNVNINKHFTKLSFQNEFLGKIYKETGMLTPIEFLDLEKMNYARISFIILLDFAYKHNENLINNLDKPTIFSSDKYLILGNNAIYQLNILENNTIDYYGSKIKSLFDVINKSSTAMGKRFIKNSICQPLNNIKEIELRYNCIDDMLHDNLFNKIEKCLECILDIERLGRKVFLAYIHPYEFANFISSFNEINNIYTLIKQTKFCCNYLPNNNILEQINEFLTSCNNTFDLTELKKQNMNDITNSFFKKGIYTQIDELNNQVVNNIQSMEEICAVLSNYIDDKKSDNKIQLKRNDRDGYYLSLTKRRANMLRNKIKNIEFIQINDSISINTNKLEFNDLIKGNTKLFLKDLNIKSADVTCLKEKLISLIKKKYIELLIDYGSKYKIMFRDISQFIAKIDFIKSNAKIAKLYNYCKPIIVENKTNGYINAQKMRHPIVERIKKDVEYVPHDIFIGKNGDNNLNGMLLFSVNGVGKCFLPNTKLIMYTGFSKEAGDIIIGDKLMGDDSLPRNIISITRGSGVMYKIIPNNGDDFIVNGQHILCLKCLGYKNISFVKNKYKVIWFDQKHIIRYKSFPINNKINSKELAFNAAQQFLNTVKTDNGDIIEISVDDYLNKSIKWKLNYYLYRVGINFSDKQLIIDPYTLGFWLINDSNISIHYLKCLNLLKNKHIPDIYKFNSIKNRLKILAGIIHAHCYNNNYNNYNNYNNNNNFNLYLKNKKLLEDILWLVRSLGFSGYLIKYNKTISSYCGIHIDLFSNMISFKIEKLNIDKYVGFEVDGNKRFLLNDFIVTHNSTLQKSIGLNLIMAQAGMYVAAEKYEYSPYESLFARITGNDNIFKGLSSFSLEMTEIKAILKRTGPKTLVIGDEVCRSTEHESGNIIVAATIIILAKSNCSFIFATHLHEIAKMKKIQQLDNVKTFHLSSEYDKNSDIIFDRKLKSGPGDEFYGLNIAKYIIKDDIFISLAQEIKNELLDVPNNLVTNKVSKYNNNLYVDSCQICNKKNSLSENYVGFLDTHHINFQSNCDENGFIIGKSHIAINNKCNLVILCKKCHYDVHHNKLQINGYIETSNGRKLDYQFLNKSSK